MLAPVLESAVAAEGARRRSALSEDNVELLCKGDFDMTSAVGWMLRPLAVVQERLARYPDRQR